MADWSNIQIAQDVLSNPLTSGADLSAIAQAQPTLWAGVAVHPNAYPELLSWLGQYGDPGVQAALASRTVNPQSGPTYAQPSPDVDSAAHAQPGFLPTSGGPQGYNQSQPLGNSDPASGYADPTSAYANPAGGSPNYPTYSAPTPIYSQGIPQAGYAPAPVKKSKRGWIIAGVAGIGVLVVVLIVIVAVASGGGGIGGGGIFGVPVPKTPSELEQAVEDRDPINCTFDISGHKATVEANDDWTKVRVSAEGFAQDVNVLSLENEGIYTWYSGLVKVGWRTPYHTDIVDYLMDEYVTSEVFDGTLSEDDFSCKEPVGDSAFELPTDIVFW